MAKTFLVLVTIPGGKVNRNESNLIMFNYNTAESNAIKSSACWN